MSASDRTLVVFTRTNARIYVNPENSFYDEVMHWPNVALNPNLAPVDGLPPHFWKLQKGTIIPMNDAEKAARLADIERYGVDNIVASKKIKFPKKRFGSRFIDYLFYVLILGAIYYLIWRGK